MLAENTVLTGRRAITRSYAKINLTLDVLSKRENGYHDIKMIMQTVSLFDLILVDKTHRGISISTNLPYLPCNEKNIAYKAADAFFQATGIRGGAKIVIHKNIPVGADVPYCFDGGTQLAEGIGEILKPLSPMPNAYILLVKPPINVSTALIYEQIDNAPIEIRPDTDGMIDSLNNNDLYGVADRLCNVMENVTAKMYPIVGGIKTKMIMNGAVNAVMSGSGPTVFGIFDDFEKAKKSADSFAYQFKDVFLTQVLN